MFSAAWVYPLLFYSNNKKGLNIYSQFQISVLTVLIAFTSRGVTNLKTRELCVGEKQAISKLREYRKSLRAIEQILAIASTSIWNDLKTKETTGALSNGCRTGRPKKHQQLKQRKRVRALKKNPKNTVKASQSTV